jgi:pantothenate synthetase
MPTHPERHTQGILHICLSQRNESIRAQLLSTPYENEHLTRTSLVKRVRTNYYYFGEKDYLTLSIIGKVLDYALSRERPW